MKVVLTMDGRTASGGMSMLMHSDRLSDPLDDYARAIAKVSKKRNKTEADYLEMGRLEFLGGMYTNGNGPCLPAWNVIRCLQDGATRHKRGRDVLRGVSPIAQHADVEYEGPRDPDVMWKQGGFQLRKPVGIRGNRTPRVRPMFSEWQAALAVEIDSNIFDLDTLVQIWHEAGIYIGIGDMRPVYGKFKGTIEVAS